MPKSRVLEPPSHLAEFFGVRRQQLCELWPRLILLAPPGVENQPAALPNALDTEELEFSLEDENRKLQKLHEMTEIRAVEDDPTLDHEDAPNEGHIQLEDNNADDMYLEKEVLVMPNLDTEPELEPEPELE
eukprot:COSAG05_NODE_11760_length_498_cov_0.621554_1_plen_130_part_01